MTDAKDEEQPDLSAEGLASMRGGWMLAKQAEIEVFGRRIVDPSTLIDLFSVGGLTMHWQVPRFSSPNIGVSREYMLRQTPSTLRRGNLRLQPGDAMPDFQLTSTTGETIGRDDLRGHPFAMRLTRTIASGVI